MSLLVCWRDVKVTSTNSRSICLRPSVRILSDQIITFAWPSSSRRIHYADVASTTFGTVFSFYRRLLNHHRQTYRIKKWKRPPPSKVKREIISSGVMTLVVTSKLMVPVLPFLKVLNT